MDTSATENYLKAIYAICAEPGATSASTGELARRLALTPGTVTGMVQRLDEAGLVDYRAHHGVQLTAAGRRLALQIVRRHRLVELFLVKTLGIPWDEVHEEAERLEHAVSDRLAARIDEHLGYPARDPHGDPIPDGEGALRTGDGEPLADCEPGTRFELLRVADAAPEFLRLLADAGLNVGATAQLVAKNRAAGVLTLRRNGHELSLAEHAARSLHVRRL